MTTRLGNYTVERALSSGGMSDALLARSPAGRLVVLKKPKANDKDLIARLRDEARLGTKLFHPHLVETIDAFEVDGLPVLALGYVEGPTVDGMRRHGPLPAAAVARIGCQVAEALGAIHEALGDDGMPLRAIHRDVSARNIIVDHKGDAVLIDLGIARYDENRAAQTATGMVLGTLRYMAPELIDGAPATPAADFYALGCVLIEAATGQPAFAGPPSEMAAAIVTKGPLASPAAASIHPKLRELLARLVARKPQDRFQAAHEVSRALRALEEALGGGQRDLAAFAQRVSAAPPEPAPVPVGAPRSASAPPPPPPLAAPFDVTQRTPAPAPSLVGRDAAQTAGWEGPTAVDGKAPAPLPAPPSPERPMTSFKPTPSMLNAPSLELAFEPRREKPVQSPEMMGNRDDWYPKRRRDFSSAIEAAKKIITVLVVVGGGIFAWRWYKAGAEADAKAAAEVLRKEQDELLRKAMEDTPECDLPGAVWIYEDKKGTSVVVEKLDSVPKAYRKSARCVAPANSR
jgi:serine/threonine protein kinase